jgi:6-phosphogluconolactonase
MLIDQLHPKAWDERRSLIIPGDYNTTLIFCVEHFVSLATAAIQDHGSFYVALSGGSTPKAIFDLLTEGRLASHLDWSKVHLFWGDERTVGPDHPDSNYRMAMSCGLGKMPIPPTQIHRMQAETDLEENAKHYEDIIRTVMHGRPFDLVMLGMGEDGHTASLFPHTQGLKVTDRLVIANEIPQKNCARMTLTFPCINLANAIVFYVLGASKKYTLSEVLLSPPDFDRYPSQGIGTKEHKALWIADEAAAADLLEKGKV